MRTRQHHARYPLVLAVVVLLPAMARAHGPAGEEGALAPLDPELFSGWQTWVHLLVQSAHLLGLPLWLGVLVAAWVFRALGLETLLFAGWAVLLLQGITGAYNSVAERGRALARREFLTVAGQAAMGALTLMVGSRAWLPPPSGATERESTSGIREIHLEAHELTWELAPGKVIKAMAYNGQIPGPEIRLKEGERVRIALTNALAEPTTIHWHGVDVPNPMDGVPGVTQKPVQPGQTFVYEFEAHPAGTRWYHTHFQEHRQLDLGLSAPLIIEPAQPEPFPFDREYTLVLDDWATGTAGAVASTREGTAGRRGGMGGMMGGMITLAQIA